MHSFHSTLHLIKQHIQKIGDSSTKRLNNDIVHAFVLKFFTSPQKQKKKKKDSSY